jgi:hypothetical protein
VSPFHDLDQRRGGPLPAKRARNLPWFGPAPSAGQCSAASSEAQGISLPRFATLLSLGVLGLAGILWLGVGGVTLVSGYAFPVSWTGPTGFSRHGQTSPSRANVRHGSSASAGATSGSSSPGAFEDGARRRRFVVKSGPAPRSRGSIEGNQPETVETRRAKDIPRGRDAEGAISGLRTVQ